MAGSTSPRTMRSGAFEIDLQAGELRKHGIKIKLQEQPFHVLAMLLEHPGEVVTREDLRRRLWAEDTFVDFDKSLNTAVNKLREAMGDEADNPRFIETLPRRGYRFIVPVEEAGATTQPFRRRLLLPMALAAASVVLLASVLFFHFRKMKPLTERDTILLADFTNTTGESAFDGTLKEALAIQLEQSPFLNIFPELRARETLRYMGRSPEERVTGDIAREICERQGIKAVLTGSITSLGSHYVIALEAMNCHTGDSLARKQVEAESREHVLGVLSNAASDLRRKLGESLSSVQKFNVPLTQATTPSLEALKAHTLAREQVLRGAFLNAVPFFKRAIELDPNFPLAYAGLGTVYSFLSEPDLAVEYTKKAYALRDRVGERERLLIASRYYSAVTGELDKTIDTLEVWKQTYPRDTAPRNNLGFVYEHMGELERAAEEYRQAIPLAPQAAVPYQNLGRVLIYLNRLADAKAVLEEAITNKMDTMNLHRWLYELAFLQGDAAAMQRQVAWAAGQPDEYRMVSEESRVALFEGKLQRARELADRASELARRRNLKGAVAFEKALLAVNAALLGECRQAHDRPPPADNPEALRNPTLMAATALAFCGNAGQAQPVVEDMARRFPTDTLLNAIELPTARAAIELNRGNSDRAIELLHSTAPYDGVRPYTIYVRGLAYLRAQMGALAVAEFQKLLDLRSVLPGAIEHALAYVGLARAYRVMGDTAKSRKAYEDFFVLWKDADPDIPILREARAEYAKLK